MQSAEMQFKEVIIEMSHNCNLSCQMCGFGFKHNLVKKEKYISDDTFKSFVDILAPKTKVLRLNGRGESTIHPHFTELLEWTHNKYPNLCINLFTNASFKNEMLIASLIKTNVQIFISFDSVKKEVLEKIRFGCKFESIADNIKRLNNAPIRPFLIATLQEDNINEIEELGDFAYQNNCSIIYNVIRSDDNNTIVGFLKYVKQNSAKISTAFENVAKMFEGSQLQCLIPDQIGGISIDTHYKTQSHGTMTTCPAIKNELCVLYNGNVTPCNMFNPYIYGNLTESSLEDIILGLKYSNFKRLYKKHYYCNNCANLGV